MKIIIGNSIAAFLFSTTCFANTGVGEIGSASARVGFENLKPAFTAPGKENEIQCAYGQGHYYYKSEFPCEGSNYTGPYIKTVEGNFVLYGNLENRKSVSYTTDWSAVTVKNFDPKATLVGQVGAINKDGTYALCHGEEEDAKPSQKDLIVDGRYSLEKMEVVAFNGVVNHCQSLGGKVLKDATGEVVILAKENKSGVRVRGLSTGFKGLIPAPRTCLTSRVAIQCDLSARANEFERIVGEFRKNYPNHPLSQ